MELAEVSLTPLQRRNRAAFLKHAALAQQQAEAGREAHVLTPGEEVVLHADGSEYFAGRVVESLLAQGEQTYLISVGVRLPQEWALLRAGRDLGLETVAAGPERDQELLDLQGEVKVASGGGVPRQDSARRAGRSRRSGLR